MLAAAAALAVHQDLSREQRATSQARDAGPNTKSSGPSASRADVPQVEPPGSESKPHLSPSAPWLTAAPTPIIVSVTVDPGTSRRRISPGGGEHSILSEDRTRTTLMLPPEALPYSQDLELSSIKSVSGLPFTGGAIAAVQVAPDSGPFRRPAKVVFETRQPVPEDQLLVGFTIRGGRELHLYPAQRIVAPELRGGRVEMPIARPGIYGVAKASATEIAAVAGHVPSDYMARLAQHIALAYPPVSQTHTITAIRSVFPVVYAQASEPLPGWLSDLFRYVEESFEQVVVTVLEELPERDCSAAPTWNAIDMFVEWATLNRMLFPIELRDYRGAPPDAWAKDTVRRSRYLHQLGYTDAQIDQIDAAMDGFRREKFNQLEKRGNPLIEQALKRLFDNMYRCCAEKRHQLNMVAAAQLGQRFGIDPIDPDETMKLLECSCRVKVKEDKSWEAFLGTITHIDEYDGSWERKSGGTREQKEQIHSSYREQIVLHWPVGKWTSASSYSVEASDDGSGYLKDHFSCGDVSEEHQSTVSAHDHGDTSVAVMPLPDQPGKYRILYMPNGADGYGSYRSHRSAKGCQIFNPESDKSFGRRASISGYPKREVVIDVDVDPSHPFELRGSRQLEEPDDRAFTQPHRPKVEWNLRRCGS